MEKDKKYNMILGFMIFFFIISIGFCIAWGLGYIGLQKNSTDEINISGGNINEADISKDNVSDGNVISNDKTANDTLLEDKPQTGNNSGNTANNTKTLSANEVEQLNKEYATKYISVMSAGSPEERVQLIMNYSSYTEMNSHYTTVVVEDLYKVTDIDYSTFIGKMDYLSQELKNKIYSYGPNTDLFKESNGKLAIYQSGWTGSAFTFTSQKLVSNNGNEYVWKVTGTKNGPDNMPITFTYNVKGKVENLKYILLSLEEVN